MWVDRNTQIANNVAIGGSTGRRLIGDQIDLGAAARDVGAGEEIYAVVSFSATCTSAGAATIRAELVSDAQVAIAVDGSATLHAASPAVALAAGAAGRQLLVVALPREVPSPYERFLGLIIDVGTAALTAGSVNCFLTTNPPVRRAYADGAR